MRGVLRLDSYPDFQEKMMKLHRLVPVAAALGALAVVGTASGQSPHAGTSTVVMTKQTSLGTILVTSSGRALYLDVADKPGHPACTAGCLAVWPALKASGTPKASGGAKAAELGTITIAGGVKQVTYNGHPLYTFVSDTKSGETSGEGEHGFYVVSASGNKVTKQSSSGSGGYGSYGSYGG